MKVVGLSALRKYSWYSFLLESSLALQNLPDYGPVIGSKYVCFIHIFFVQHGSLICTRRC